MQVIAGLETEMGRKDQEAIQKRIAEGVERQRKEEMKKKKAEWKKERTSFWTDFKKFVTRGNVLDMAVAVVVANAFNAIVSGLVKNVITPCVTYLTSGVSINEWKYVLREAVPAVLDEAGEVVTAEVTEIAIMYGIWIQTIVDFLIIAFSIFVFVRVVNNMQKKMNWKEEQKKAEETAKKAEADKIAAEKAKAEADALKAREDAFYANVQAQADLLREIKEIVAKK